MKWKFLIGTILIASISGIFLFINYNFVKQPNQATVLGMSDYKNKNETINSISAREARRLIYENSKNPSFVILDVRTEKERFNNGYIENSTNLDFYSLDFKDSLAKLDQNKTYLIHCHSGTRSLLTTEILESLNFKNIYNLSGGIMSWQAEGFKLEK